MRVFRPTAIRHIAVLLSAVAVFFISPGQSRAAGLMQKWLVALDGCVSLVEAGDASALAASDWTQDALDGDVTFEHGSGVAITARLPLYRSEKTDAACWLSYGSKIAGNDRRGQVLRETLRDFADGRLRFLEEDQFLPPDIYRGCAWDGLEFRLSSMTQTTYANFHIQLSRRAPECAALAS